MHMVEIRVYGNLNSREDVLLRAVVLRVVGFSVLSEVHDVAISACSSQGPIGLSPKLSELRLSFIANSLRLHSACLTPQT